MESRAGHERLKARRRELNKRKKEKPTPAGGGQTPLSAAGRREERKPRVGDVWDRVVWDPRVGGCCRCELGARGGVREGSREGVMPTWLDAWGDQLGWTTRALVFLVGTTVPVPARQRIKKNLDKENAT